MLRRIRDSERQVYPRVCGGTVIGSRELFDHTGLSPRVRGNPGPKKQPMAQHGSIPACAGEPASGGDAGGDHQVYPRVCGGTGAREANAGRRWGLSPRVRGNLRMTTAENPLLGSIPACAGEPWTFTARRMEGEVYPRVCGGTATTCGPAACPAGLSPRVRGNPQSPADACARKRSIPACAGEPGAGPFLPGRSKVYPRVCGGTPTVELPDPVLYGLSPRVRGNPSAQSGDAL